LLVPYFHNPKKVPRCYQRIAIDRAVASIVQGHKRNLLTLATGTGKTMVAFQVCWKLWSAGWNARGEPMRKPRILFLADRNVLVDDPKDKDFAPFGDARWKIDHRSPIPDAFGTVSSACGCLASPPPIPTLTLVSPPRCVPMPRWLCWLLLCLFPNWTVAAPPGARVGVVSNIQVLSDQVPDVSSLEAWKRSFLKDGMSDEEKALAAWRTTVMFQHQDAPPCEFLQHEVVVQDPIKIFNVYGYSFCSVASCDVEALARAAGLKARGWAINGHSVPEVWWDGRWHLLDASLINYFRQPDGTIAGVEEVFSAVNAWYAQHPECKRNAAKLEAVQRADNWTGWKTGPGLLAACPFYDAGGFWPARTHGWASTMQEYDGTDGKKGKPFLYEYGYAQGYRVNVQLRPGERLVRNWSNKGLHVNTPAAAPGCLTGQTGKGALVYTPAYGDLAPGRIGNGTLEYDVPVANAAYRTAALEARNLDANAVRVEDPAQPGIFVLRMPCSYVYLSGTLSFSVARGTGDSCAVAIFFSDNNGLDYKEIARVTEPGPHQVDLTPLVWRRYDYRLKFELRGRGTGLDALRSVHIIQHSQRPLPALGRGRNSLIFRAGPPEGTITVEGSTRLDSRGKQLVWSDFHPEVEGFEPNLFIGPTGKGSITFPVTTPGNLVRLRFGAHYRARDAKDGLDYQISFDAGKKWKTIDRAAGPTAGDCKYVVCEEVPPNTRQALVRFAGTSRNATGLLNFRIDADYREPYGGFHAVKVTFTWEEDGRPRDNVHIARQPEETFTLDCAARPVMKTLMLELAD
jgi:hypothetical protein